MADLEAGARKRGRPRVEGALTGAERAALSRQRLRGSGGHEMSLLLAPSAWATLQRLAPRGERSALIERLLLEEERRRAAGGDSIVRGVRGQMDDGRTKK